MTIQELKDAIAKLPNDAEVFVKDNHENIINVDRYNLCYYPRLLHDKVEKEGASIKDIFDYICKEYKDIAEIRQNGGNINYEGMFHRWPSKYDSGWKWFIDNGTYLIVHTDPDKYELDWSRLSDVYNAADILYHLQAKPWFTLENARQFVSCINKKFRRNYTVNGMLNIAMNG